ncbi:MAG TPA: hypothetical protein VND64_23440 [Pirellulales bacterium]|nr:hypothetical protein [Pirellulales bacterium]
MGARAGDKVRLKRVADSGDRGIVQQVERGALVVRLESSGRSVRVPVENVTNLSLAARKAWASMPLRAVGRPKGSRVYDRVSVTLRVDRELWDHFKELEAAGMILDRTATINRWFAEKMAELQGMDR